MHASSHREHELDTAAAHWYRAFEAESRALDAASPFLPGATITGERLALARERHAAGTLLEALARTRGIAPVPWLPRVHVTPRSLGLPEQTLACVFDLDGVLTDSGRVHAAAWAETLDPLLLDVAQSTGHAYAPFDRDGDYRAYLDGRLRAEGIRLFLASRGLELPEGRRDGLARRKGEILERVLLRHGISALPGARRYLQTAGFAQITCAVVSASTTTLSMLCSAALEHLVAVRADADTISPRLLLAACGELGVEPTLAVALTHSSPGVAAARSIGMHVIGVAPEPIAAELRDFGATRVVPALSALLAA
jgi:beta-phosphoglucomutase-like phosphatase (HAD superfamily)